MIRRRALLVSAALLTPASLVRAADKTVEKGSFWLVPPEDYKPTAADMAEWMKTGPDPLVFGDPPGDTPRIIIDKPKASALPLKSPLDITLRFEVPTGSRIVPGSFRLKARTMGMWLDVTSEVLKRAIVTPNGITVSGAMLPAGKHKIRLEIADNTSRVGVAELAFQVIA